MSRGSRIFLLVAVVCAACKDASPTTDHDAGADAGDSSLVDAGAVVDPADPDTWAEPARPVLPTRPAWAPAFGPFGAADSSTAFCNRDTGSLRHATIFASSHGVYVATRIENNLLEETEWSGRPSGLAVHRWTGGAWQQRLWAPTEASTSAPTLFVDASENYYLAWQFGCGLHRLVPGAVSSATLTCYLPGVTNGEVPRAVSSSDSGLSSLITNGSAYSWGSDTFTAIPSLSNAIDGTVATASVWDDAQKILVTGASSYFQVYDRSTQQTTPLGNSVPAGDIRSAVRDWNGAYVLAYDGGALVRYDGVDATLVSLGHACENTVDRMWANGTYVYYQTATAFGRLGADGHHVYIDQPCAMPTHLRSMHGLGSDVYLVVEDTSSINYECGSIYVVRFDGSMFHEM